MIEWRDFYNIFLESLSLLIVFHFTLTLHYIKNEICILFSFFIFVLIKRNETNAPLTSFPLLIFYHKSIGKKNHILFSFFKVTWRKSWIQVKEDHKIEKCSSYVDPFSH